MAKFYDWRPNASRAIFFLGDEALEGGNTNGKQDEADIEAASRAIDAANEAGVRVHMYMGTSSVMPQVRKAIEAELRLSELRSLSSAIHEQLRWMLSHA